MKLIRPAILVALVSLVVTGLTGKAMLIQSTDPSFGPDSLVTDTTTGLTWLSLTASAGLSYDQYPLIVVFIIAAKGSRSRRFGHLQKYAGQNGRVHGHTRCA